MDTLHPQIKEGDQVEIIVNDLLKEHRSLEKFFKRYPKVTCKVIQQDNFWLREGFASYSEPWNSGAEVASGDYLVFVGDSVSFPPQFMDKLREKAEGGYVAQFLYATKFDEYLEVDGKINEDYETIDQVVEAGKFDAATFTPGDPRWWHNEWKSGCDQITTFYEVNWQHCYGVFGMPREVFYMLNGFDENFEGQKDHNDVEIFSRLQMLWPTIKINFDRSLYIYRHPHSPVFNRVHKQLHTGGQLRINYDLIQMFRLTGVTRANCTIHDHHLLNKVVDGRLSGYATFLRTAKDRRKNESKMIKYWINNQPMRELKDSRVG
jgi:hypothetical protein